MGPLFIAMMLAQTPPPLVAAPPAFEPGQVYGGVPFPRDFTAQEIFVARCAACHGREGKGNGALRKFGGLGARDVTSSEWQASRSDEQIRSAIADGLAGTRMKGFRALGTRVQIEELVKLLRSMRVALVPAPAGEVPEPQL